MMRLRYPERVGPRKWRSRAKPVVAPNREAGDN